MSVEEAHNTGECESARTVTHWRMLGAPGQAARRAACWPGRARCARRPSSASTSWTQRARRRRAPSLRSTALCTTGTWPRPLYNKRSSAAESEPGGGLQWMLRACLGCCPVPGMPSAHSMCVVLEVHELSMVPAMHAMDRFEASFTGYELPCRGSALASCMRHPSLLASLDAPKLSSGSQPTAAIEQGQGRQAAAVVPQRGLADHLARALHRRLLAEGRDDGVQEAGHLPPRLCHLQLTTACASVLRPLQPARPQLSRATGTCAPKPLFEGAGCMPGRGRRLAPGMQAS